MHELSIVQGLADQLATIAKRHGARRVHRVVVEVGVLSNVVPRLLTEAFYAFREMEPLLSSAELVVREMQLVIECRSCGNRSSLERLRLRCPACSGTQVEVRHGEELHLRDVELEIEEESGNDADATGESQGTPAAVE